MLRCHRHGLQENTIINDELDRHLHVTWKIIVGVSQGCDTDTCEEGLSIAWQLRHRRVLTVKLNANSRTLLNQRSRQEVGDTHTVFNLDMIVKGRSLKARKPVLYMPNSHAAST
jgi:hypothetical protein